MSVSQLKPDQQGKFVAIERYPPSGVPSWARLWRAPMIGSSEGSSGRDFMKRGRDSSSASFSSGDFAFGGGWGNVAAMVLSVVSRKED
jgi:hypothetical protein